MPMLLIAEAESLEEAYAGMADKMTPLMRAAKGFICLAGWRLLGAVAVHVCCTTSPASLAHALKRS